MSVPPSATLGVSLQRVLNSFAAGRCYACGWPLGSRASCEPFNCSMRFSEDAKDLAEKEGWHARQKEMSDVFVHFTSTVSETRAPFYNVTGPLHMVCQCDKCKAAPDASQQNERRILTKHCRIGNTVIRAGCYWDTVIARAEREYEYQDKDETPPSARVPNDQAAIDFEEAALDHRDAERYRWLKTRLGVPGAVASWLRFNNWSPDTKFEPSIDAAIDKAMEAE